VDVRVSRRKLDCGERLDYRLRLRPQGKLSLNAVSLTLHGFEKITWKGHKNRAHSATHTLYRRRAFLRLPLPASRTVDRGDRLSQDGSFELPAEGPPSFEASGNKIIWRLELAVDIAGLPDVEKSWPLTVRPQLRGEG